MEKKKAYIIYKYNKNNNDIEYLKEYDNIKEIKKDFNLKEKTNLSKYYINNIDNINNINNINRLLNNKYIIFKDII